MSSPDETVATPAEAVASLAETVATPTEAVASLAETVATPAEAVAVVAINDVAPEHLAISPADPGQGEHGHYCAFDHSGCRGERCGCLSNQVIKQEYALQHFVIDSVQIVLNQTAVFQIHIITDSKTVYRTVIMPHDDYALWVDDNYPFAYIKARVADIFRSEG